MHRIPGAGAHPDRRVELGGDELVECAHSGPVPRPLVSFWQAAGLLVLSKILFGGFRGRGGHHGWHGRHGHWGREMWRQKWESMTPEERDRLRAKFKGRCGWGSEEPPPSEQAKP